MEPRTIELRNILKSCQGFLDLILFMVYSVINESMGPSGYKYEGTLARTWMETAIQTQRRRKISHVLAHDSLSKL